MTFDAWIDAVDRGVKAELGSGVHTEELSWDSAMWVGPNGTVVAALADDGSTARISSDRTLRTELAYRETEPAVAIATISARLGR